MNIRCWIDTATLDLAHLLRIVLLVCYVYLVGLLLSWGLDVSQGGEGIMELDIEPVPQGGVAISSKLGDVVGHPSAGSLLTVFAQLTVTAALAVLERPGEAAGAAIFRHQLHCLGS